MIRPIENTITRYLHDKASINKVPLNGTFELSPLCNMDCKMCYVRMSSEEMSKVGKPLGIKDWLSLAEEATSAGMTYLLLTGGEPFLYKDFRQLYEELDSFGLVISINSNGTLISEETIKWLSKRPPNRINITLYGASNETYSRLCNNPIGFDQVTNSLRLLKDAGISVKLNCSLTPYNAHDLEALIEYSEKNDLILQVASYMFPPTRRDSLMLGKNDRFSSKEAAEYSIKTLYLQYKEKLFLNYAREIEEKRLILPGHDECQSIEDRKVRCRAGRAAFWVTWDGRMLPCGMMNSPMARPLDKGFLPAWQYITREVDKIVLCKECASCEYRRVCNVCAAMAQTETGDFNKLPEYYCKMTHYSLQEVKRLGNRINNSNL